MDFREILWNSRKKMQLSLIRQEILSSIYRDIKQMEQQTTHFLSLLLSKDSVALVQDADSVSDYIQIYRLHTSFLSATQSSTTLCLFFPNKIRLLSFAQCSNRLSQLCDVDRKILLGASFTSMWKKNVGRFAAATFCLSTILSVSLFSRLYFFYSSLASFSLSFSSSCSTSRLSSFFITIHSQLSKPMIRFSFNFRSQHDSSSRDGVCRKRGDAHPIHAQPGSADDHSLSLDSRRGKIALS